MKLKFFGINGFEIRSGGTTLLIDPYVSRDSNKLCVPEVVRKHVTDADYLVFGHSHWDHLADIPEIVAYTEPIIAGSETTLNICRYFKVPDERLLPFHNRTPIEMGPFTVTPFRSLHMQPMSYSGSYESIPEKLDCAEDYLEGGTWALLLEVEGNRVLNVSSANFIEEEIQGIECDYLMTSIAGRAPDFLTHMLRCVKAKVLIPVHWDSFEHPVENAPESTSLDAFRQEMAEIAPAQSIKVIHPLETLLLPERA